MLELKRLLLKWIAKNLLYKIDIKTIAKVVLAIIFGIFLFVNFDSPSYSGDNGDIGKQPMIKLVHKWKVDCPAFKGDKHSACSENSHWIIYFYGREVKKDDLKMVLKKFAENQKNTKVPVYISADKYTSWGIVSDILIRVAFAGITNMVFSEYERLKGYNTPSDDDSKKEDDIPPSMFIEDVRVFLKWDKTANKTIRQVGPDLVNTDDEFKNQVQQLHQRKARAQEMPPEEVPVEIDAEKEVPWHEVMTVRSLCKQLSIKKIEFAVPIGYRTEEYK